jgi:hypothetical protein
LHDIFYCISNIYCMTLSDVSIMWCVMYDISCCISNISLMICRVVLIKMC